MKQQSLEQQLNSRIEKSKAVVKLKYFKSFCQAKTDDERNEIGAKMNVLDAVTYDVVKGIKQSLDN